MDDDKNIKVVIVESTNSDAEMLGLIFRKSGFDCQYFDDAFNAISHFKIELPDIIVINTRLPKLSGFELCERIKSNPLTEYIPIIMLTSINSREEMERIFQLGATDMLIKPFKFWELILRAKKIVQERQLY